MARRMSKEARLVRSLSKKGYQKQTPIATDTYIPNHSGLLKNQDAKNSLDDTYVKKAGDTMTGPLNITDIQQTNTTDTDNNFYQRVRFHNTTEAFCLGTNTEQSEIKFKWGQGTCKIETTGGHYFMIDESNGRCHFNDVSTLYDGTNSVSIAQMKTAYDHSQDNTQAHSDYLINNGDDTTSGTLTAANFNTTGVVQGSKCMIPFNKYTITSSAWFAAAGDRTCSSSRGYCMPRDGSITAWSHHYDWNSHTTNGDTSLQIKINNTTKITNTDTHTAAQWGLNKYGTVSRGTHTFNAGDIIHVYLNYDGAVAGSCRNHIVLVEVTFDT